MAASSKSLHRVALTRIEAVEARVVAALERIGYRLLAAEIDVDVGRARVEVRRHDGYTLTLDVRNGAGTITREMQRCETVATGRRGDRFRAERLSMQFLGRERVDGARTALQAFAAMIGDNALMTSIQARQSADHACAQILTAICDACRCDYRKSLEPVD